MKLLAPVLEANIDILTEMREHYQSILRSQECPDEIKTGCQREFADYEKRITHIITDLHRQRSRTQILSRLLSDRKSLVSSHSLDLPVCRPKHFETNLN
jgi:hypothetical protein